MQVDWRNHTVSTPEALKWGSSETGIKSKYERSGLMISLGESYDQ